MRSKSAFTLLELIAVLFVIALIVAFLLPSLSAGPDVAPRAMCAANLRGIGQSMHIYSNDNNDWFPVALHKPAAEDSAGVSEIDFVGRLGRDMQRDISTENWTTAHPSRSMFMLVIQGSSTTKQFICPASGDHEDDLRNPVGPRGETAAQPGINRFDFKGYPYVSYGYHFPYGARALQNQNLDVRMVLMADKGPYFEAEGDNDKHSNIQPPTSFGTDGRKILQIDRDRWRPYNSRNHNSEGQNVLYLDDHVDFNKKPTVGVNNDNIYTIQTGRTLADSLIGRRPDNRLGPLTDTDSVIVP